MDLQYAGGTISSDEVIKHVNLTGQGDEIYLQMVKVKEAVNKGRELGVTVTDEQLQQFADSYRTLRGLHTAEETMAFLQSAGVTEDDFEDFCEASVLTDLVMEQIASQQAIEECFVSNRTGFDVARVSMIVVGDANLASEIAIQVLEDGEDFHALAGKYSTDETTKAAGGYVGNLSRTAFPEDVAAKVFNASPGDLVGPLGSDGSFQLILVEEVIKADLKSDDVRAAVRERIADEWVSQFLKDGITAKP